jgi:peptide/nickel transport system substrate-binding protein
LINGEVDYFESPANDLMPLLEANDGITVEINDPLGNIGFARFNHLLPPFDKAEVRRAAIMAMKQEDYMTGAVGDQKFWKTCYSVYPCGTPLANEVGSDVIKTGDIEKAKAALEAAGYDGTPVVIMQPTDIPLLSAFSLITAEKLRNTGFKVEVQAMDWSTLTSRRAKRDPVADGGWNMFHTWWIGADVIDPMAIAFSGNPDKGWFGWPTDPELEAARKAYAGAKSAEEKKAAGEKVQERLWAIGASGQLGQFFVPVAYRNNVKGLIKSRSSSSGTCRSSKTSHATQGPADAATLPPGNTSIGAIDAGLYLQANSGDRACHGCGGAVRFPDVAAVAGRPRSGHCGRLCDG